MTAGYTIIRPKSESLRFKKVKIYFKELKNLPILKIPYKNIYNPNYLDFMILCKTKNIKDKLFKFLLSRGFETRYFSYRDCSTLKIYKKYGLKKIINSTYQAVSGAGKEGIDELLDQTNIVGSEIKTKVFEHPIAYNVIPKIGDYYNNGYTTEENKFINETHKILNDDSIAISCTAVRVPTIRTHCESITVETEKELDSVEEIIEYLKYQPMISFNNLPMPDNASNIDDVLYGRIRKNNLFGNNGLDMFIAGDQIRRGAALNAILIAEEIIGTRK